MFNEFHPVVGYRNATERLKAGDRVLKYDSTGTIIMNWRLEFSNQKGY